MRKRTAAHQRRRRKKKNKKTKRKVSCFRGRGLITSVLKKAASAAASAAGTLVNKGVDLLPIELHIPGYQYCGPGTELDKRLRRQDPGINKLDKACKEHDISYSTYGDNKHRAEADKELAERAWERVTANDSSLAEKAAAWTVTNLMKAKAKFGGGGRRRRRRRTNRVAGGRKGRAAAAALRRLKAIVGRGLYLKPYKGGGVRKKKKVHRRRRRYRT